MSEELRKHRGQISKEVLQSYGLSVAYDGEMKEGRPHGYGKAYYRDGRFYEGE